MTNKTRRADDWPPSRWWQRQFQLTALLGFVVVCAIGSVAFKRYRETHAIWEQFGGMNGWSQAAIEARLGPPRQVIEGDAPDEHEQKITPRSPGVYRTCQYQNFDGHFVVWYRQTKQGGFDCFGSKWVEKRRYY